MKKAEKIRSWTQPNAAFGLRSLIEFGVRRTQLESNELDLFWREYFLAGDKSRISQSHSEAVVGPDPHPEPIARTSWSNVRKIQPGQLIEPVRPNDE